MRVLFAGLINFESLSSLRKTNSRFRSDALYTAWLSQWKSESHGIFRLSFQYDWREEVFCSGSMLDSGVRGMELLGLWHLTVRDRLSCDRLVKFKSGVLFSPDRMNGFWKERQWTHQWMNLSNSLHCCLSSRLARCWPETELIESFARDARNNGDA